MKKYLLFIPLLFASVITMAQEVYTSPSLQMAQIAPNVFIHLSQIDIPNYGKFPCNGLVFFSEEEAIICDTPTDDAISKELIDWVQTSQKRTIKAIIVTHFHDDCLGGLQAFYDANIPSYANRQTIQLAKEQNKILPQNPIDGELALKIGYDTMINKHFGAGHTVDNIVCYLPNQQVLFGGCLIKEMDGNKGNLADADVAAWSNTVNRIKSEWPNIKIVVPGHGKAGGVELLDYTIGLFRTLKH